MTNKLQILILFSLFFVSCNSKIEQKSDSKILSKKIEKPLILIFAGDVMNHLPQTHAAYVKGESNYDYTPSFKFIKPYVETADIAFCNLELPLAGKPYMGYPRFSGPDEMLDAVKWTGFDVIQTANNHIMDRGHYGNKRTIEKIQQRNLYFVGSYASREQRDSVNPLIINKNNIKIAILNYTYGTNVRKEKPSIVNVLDSVAILNDLKNAKLLTADFIIATVHWGTEYELNCNSIQRKWADFFIRNGVDLIIGSHPHVVQNFTIKQFEGKNIPIFYSLGNVTSNQRGKNKNGGILARIEIDTSHKVVKNVSYLSFYLLRGVLDKKFQYYILPTDEYVINHSLYPISQYDSLQLMYFHKQTIKTLQNIPSYFERL